MASELIYKADAHKAILKENPSIAYCIDNIKPVDAVEVVHGEWIRNEDDECYWYTCSECAEYPMRDRWGEEKLTDYCPNCGAKMDGDGNGN